jgi:hypothetical protein
VKRVRINLIDALVFKCYSNYSAGTFFILARRKLLTRNLNLSSSVCMIINVKLVFGSMLPVWSSTSSI